MVSRDGGASWTTVVAAPNQLVILNWFVSADGHVLASPTTPFVSPGVSATAVVGTAVAGTAVVGTAVPFPPPTFQSGGHPLLNGTPSGGAYNSPADVTPVSGKSYIMSYDPANNRWSNVTTPPENGELLEVTPASANGGAILWFMGTGTKGTQYTLYRYVV
jgi:hypothetical protein